MQFFKRRATINSERLSTDIKEVAVMKSKFSAKEGDESSPPAPPPSPLYIPDSATSEFHLFDSLKEPLRGRRFADDDDDDDDLQQRASKGSDASAMSFRQREYSVSRKDGKSVLTVETLWKNNPKFVKKVPMIYIYIYIYLFICNCDYSAREKNRRLYFRTATRSSLILHWHEPRYSQMQVKLSTRH